MYIYHFFWFNITLKCIYFYYGTTGRNQRRRFCYVLHSSNRLCSQIEVNLLILHLDDDYSYNPPHWLVGWWLKYEYHKYNYNYTLL